VAVKRTMQLCSVLFSLADNQSDVLLPLRMHTMTQPLSPLTNCFDVM